MRATDYAPMAPLQSVPSGPYVPPGQRADALADALRGVELGAYDEQMCAWMAGMLDDPTMRTIVSLILRAREAGRRQAAGEAQEQIDAVFAAESLIPAAERGSFLVEEAYRDGMVRVVDALGHTIPGRGATA